jgi:hypothetical protein
VEFIQTTNILVFGNSTTAKMASEPQNFEPSDKRRELIAQIATAVAIAGGSQSSTKAFWAFMNVVPIAKLESMLRCLEVGKNNLTAVSIESTVAGGIAAMKLWR